MSGENIFNLFAQDQQKQQQQQALQAEANRKADPTFSGKYKKRFEEPPKPVYSTFHQKGKEYDGTNVRFFRSRHAVIGKNVAPEVDPKNFLHKGGGVRHVVPPIHEEKIYTKPPVDFTKPAFTWADDSDEEGGGGGGGGEADGWKGTFDMGDDDDGPNSAQAPVVAARGLNLNVGPAPADATNDQPVGTKKREVNLQWAPAECTKDFVKSNIVEMSTMVPKRRVDEIEHPTNRRDFGKTPAYLKRVKGELENEQTFLRSIDDQKAARQADMYSQYVYRLPENQRKLIMEKLQEKLKEKKSVFDSLPFSRDTASMAKKKNDLEQAINDLETAIQKLDREAIFVYRDDPVNSQWTKAAAMKEAQAYVQANPRPSP